MRPVNFDGQQQEVRIKVDVNEDDKSYTVHADIPGEKKKISMSPLRAAKLPSARK